MNDKGKKKQKKYDVLVIGAGAAGMTAAILAARGGLRTALLESNEVLGKKILATGNGRCNFANSYQDISCYRGGNPKMAMRLQERFSLEHVLDFMKSLGIFPKEKDGYWYPYAEQAVCVRDAFQMELTQSGVDIYLNCHADRIIPVAEKDNGFLVEATGRDIIENHTPVKKGRTPKTLFSEPYPMHFETEALVLAGGGIAGNISGADGSCYRIAKELQHHIVEPIPALVQLKSDFEFCKELAGQRVQAMGTLSIAGQCYQERGEFLFTEYGISGIPTLQLSRYASEALYRKKNVEEIKMLLDFFPDTSENELSELLRTRLTSFPDRTMYEVLNGLLPGKLNRVLLLQLEINPESHITKKTWSGKTSELLARKMKHFEMTITGTNAMEHAQVTAGGIDMNELNPDSMESTQHKNLYIIGELTDMDGTCGGYNLQWAFMSAMAAAQAVVRKKNCPEMEK